FSYQVPFGSLLGPFLDGGQKGETTKKQQQQQQHLSSSSDDPVLESTENMQQPQSHHQSLPVAVVVFRSPVYLCSLVHP
ncbi:unnamed protein product, partial [Ilex paraguariensis]